MDSPIQTVSPLRQRMVEDMRMRKLGTRSHPSGQTVCNHQ